MLQTLKSFLIDRNVFLQASSSLVALGANSNPPSPTVSMWPLSVHQKKKKSYKKLELSNSNKLHSLQLLESHWIEVWKWPTKKKKDKKEGEPGPLWAHWNGTNLL